MSYLPISANILALRVPIPLKERLLFSKSSFVMLEMTSETETLSHSAAFVVKKNGFSTAMKTLLRSSHRKESSAEF